jgi:hypothetical protein
MAEPHSLHMCAFKQINLDLISHRSMNRHAIFFDFQDEARAGGLSNYLNMGSGANS